MIWKPLIVIKQFFCLLMSMVCVYFHQTETHYVYKHVPVLFKKYHCRHNTELGSRFRCTETFCCLSSFAIQINFLNRNSIALLGSAAFTLVSFL